MQMTYSATADALAVRLAKPKGKVVTQEVAPDVYLDIDSRGLTVGIEVLNASAHYPKESLDGIASPVDWLSLVEAGQEAGVTPDVLRVQIHAGRIPAEKRGRDWVIARHELVNYLENKSSAGRPATVRAARSGAKKSRAARRSGSSKA